MLELSILNLVLRFINAKNWNTVFGDKKQMSNNSFAEAIKSKLIDATLILFLVYLFNCFSQVLVFLVSVCSLFSYPSLISIIPFVQPISISYDSNLVAI